MDNISLLKKVLLIESKAIEACATKITTEQSKKLITIFKNLKESNGSLIISGVGKSGHIAQKVAATFSSLGLPSFFLHPVEAMHGDLGRITKLDAIVLISKSGTTEELLALLPYINLPQERVICIVGNINSPIARGSGVVLDGSVEKEACLNDLAPTTSTTVALALGDAIAVLYEKVSGLSREGFAINHPAGLLGKSLSLTVDKLLIKQKDCAILSLNSTLQDAIIAMTEKPIGMAVILEKDQLKGIIVEGDIRRAFAKYSDPLKKPISKFMTMDPVSISPKSLAIDALLLMEMPGKQVTVVPVIEDGIFVGSLRLHDLFKAGFNSSFANPTLHA